MKVSTIMLCTVALSLGACSSYGSPSASGPRYVPRAEVVQENYTQIERRQDRSDIRSYEQYEEREPCQRYRRTPRQYADGCPRTEAALHRALQSYTVFFDFDKAAIRPDENATLNLIARELRKYHPSQVTVTGYTDSSGAADYNQALSRERERAVSSALMERGIGNRILDRDARGEYGQAVKTADGVRNQKNRRVVVDFWR